MMRSNLMAGLVVLVLIGVVFFASLAVNNSQITGLAVTRPASACVDSDASQAKPEFVKGKTDSLIEGGSRAGTMGSAVDACLNYDELKEYSCNSANHLVASKIRCAYGCTQGACRSTPLCTDSDGGLVKTVKGTMTVNGVIYGSDYCSYDFSRFSSVLMEYTCNTNRTTGSLEGINCGADICLDGRCVPKPPEAAGLNCFDSDGNNPSTKGYIVLGDGYTPAAAGRAFQDYCSTSNRLFEFLCMPGNANGTIPAYAYQREVVCPNGCSDGKCN